MLNYQWLLVYLPSFQKYNVYLQCLGAEHTGCGSATFQAFVLIIIITCGNKCGMDSGVASYWLFIRILLPYLCLHFRHHCPSWDKFGFPERTFCFIVVFKPRNAFSRTVLWKMSIPLESSTILMIIIIIIDDDTDSWFHNGLVLKQKGCLSILKQVRNRV